MKEKQIVKAKEDYYPLYRRGDKFKIIIINKNPDLMPIEALHLRKNKIYGFFKEELI